MISPIEKPRFRPEMFQYEALESSFFGRLLAENGTDFRDLGNSVRVLSEQSARMVWISTFGKAAHKFSIDESNWSKKLRWEYAGSWLVFYSRSECMPVEQQLRSIVDWSDDQEILFIKGPLDCVYTKWDSFLQNWLTFVEYDDDGSYIIPLNVDGVLRVSPTGTFIKGTTTSR